MCILCVHAQAPTCVWFMIREAGVHPQVLQLGYHPSWFCLWGRTSHWPGAHNSAGLTSPGVPGSGPSSSSQFCHYRTIAPFLELLRGSWWSNLGPYAHVARTFLVERSPGPCAFCIYLPNIFMVSLPTSTSLTTARLLSWQQERALLCPGT